MEATVYTVFEYPDAGFRYKWYRGQTVNVYDLESDEEIDVFTLQAPGGQGDSGRNPRYRDVLSATERDASERMVVANENTQ